MASAVKDTLVSAKALVPPVKGNKVDNNGLINTLRSASKHWGTSLNTALKTYMI